MIASTKDRRRSPRVDTSIPLKISCEDFDLVAETRNISSLGAYCTMSQYLEPMTKLKIQLLLPFKKNNQLIPKKILCQGVVVRTQAHQESKSFDVAIYFSEIHEKDRKLIVEHITGVLKQELETHSK